MTYRKGFFLIDIIYGLFLISFLVVVLLSQYAQVATVLQQTIIETKAMNLAVKEVEAMRARAGEPFSDQIESDDFTIHRRAHRETKTERTTLVHLMVSVMHTARTIVTLETGVLYEKKLP